MPPPPPRPNRPATTRTAAQKPAAPPPPPPAPGTVKPSTRMTASKAPAPAPAPRVSPPPPIPAKLSGRTAAAGKPPTARTNRPRQATPDEDDDGAAAARPSGLAKLLSGGNRKLILIVAGLGVVLIAIIVLAMAWGPMQRSSQLAEIDACREGSRIEEGNRLAVAFANQWGPRSQYVVNAITSGRGSLEARIEMCRVGGHLRLLAQMLNDDKLTPAQRGLLCAALSMGWPLDGSGPGISDSLSAWALDPESDPALADPALRLLVAVAAPDTEDHLARAAIDGRLKTERAVSVALSLGRVVDKRGGGVASMIAAINGPHRAALLASAPIVDCIRNNAIPADAPKLLGLLAKPDTVVLGLSGLGGKRFQIGESDTKARADLIAELEPFLKPTTEDAVLAGALLVVHRQRLIGARAQVIALLPRLAKKRPEQLSKDALVDLLGRSLVSSRTPEAVTAAEEMVTALTEALDQTDTRALAMVALSRVQDPNIAALRLALDSLAGFGEDGDGALDILVGKVYDRADIVKAAGSRGWSAVLAEDRRKRARYDAIVRWLSDHSEETTARTDSATMAANKTELGRMRDEIRGWQDSKEPLPLGLTKTTLEDLLKRVQLMTSMVIKGTHTN